LTEKYDSFSLNLYQILFGMLLLSLLALGEGHKIPTVTSGIMINLLFLAVCCSALGYIFYLYALSHLGATVVTTFINFIPVFGVLGGVLILHEPFGLDQLIGGLVILVGVTLVSRNREKRPKITMKEAEVSG
jgi:drug/metabolite transporter (DMT)-like permease